MTKLSRRSWMCAAAGMTAGGLHLTAAPKIPRPAGELVITLPSKSLAKVSDYKGKVIALEVLLTTCPHCQRCSQVLQRMYEEFGPKGFQPLGAAVNEGAWNAIPGYVMGLGLKFPVGVSPTAAAYDFLQVSTDTGKPIYMPQLAFIDRSGTIRHQFAGTDDFFLPDKEEANVRKILESLLSGGKKGS